MMCGGRQKLSLIQRVDDIMISISCAEGPGTNSVDPIPGISVEGTYVLEEQRTGLGE